MPRHLHGPQNGSNLPIPLSTLFLCPALEKTTTDSIRPVMQRFEETKLSKILIKHFLRWQIHHNHAKYFEGDLCFICAHSFFPAVVLKMSYGRNGSEGRVKGRVLKGW